MHSQVPGPEHSLVKGPLGAPPHFRAVLAAHSAPPDLVEKGLGSLHSLKEGTAGFGRCWVIQGTRRTERLGVTKSAHVAFQPGGTEACGSGSRIVTIPSWGLIKWKGSGTEFQMFRLTKRFIPQGQASTILGATSIAIDTVKASAQD